MSCHEGNDLRQLLGERATPEASEEEKILTVSDLTYCLQQVISEDTFQSLSVQGEVSGLRETQNGHVFFILRDERSQISCVLWNSYRRLGMELPGDGEEVIVSGGLRIKKLNQKLTSEILLQATRIQRGIGKGSFWKLFEQTKQKLTAEGLFSPERKRSIPRFPRRVALITSPVGAVLHDFLSIAHQRDPSVEIVVFPSSVQGEDARESLVRTLQLVNSPATERQVGKIDVVVIARGGGSPDDLLAFNTEEVVRAVASSRIPTVSAIGHEPDVTLTDFAADLRAATPSAAAQQVIPDRSTLLANIAQLHDKLERLTRMYLALLENQLMRLSERKWFKEPDGILWSHHRACEGLLNRARNAYSERLRHHSKRITDLSSRLAYHSPHAQIHRSCSSFSIRSCGVVFRNTKRRDFTGRFR